MAGGVKKIRELALFSQLDDEQMDKIRSIIRFKELSRKEVLFRQGDPVDGIYMLLSGRMKLYKLSGEGKEHILHMVSPGQGFAEAAIFLPDGYPAFAEAVQSATIAMLPKTDFLDLLRREPELSLRIIAGLSLHLKRFADRIEDLSLKGVPARLAGWMLSTSAEIGHDFWEMDITKGELASQLGTVGETLSRTLKKFKDAGWIQVRGRFMKILDREALEAVAQSME